MKSRSLQKNPRVASKVINIDIPQDVKLSRSDNAWKPGHKKDNAVDEATEVCAQIMPICGWGLGVVEKFSVKKCLKVYQALGAHEHRKEYGVKRVFGGVR